MRDTPHRTITELEDRLRRANEVIASSSPSYTLREIEALTREYVGEFVKRDGESDLQVELVLSRYLQWLARREREGRDGR